jgi:hypothetical protein
MVQNVVLNNSDHAFSVLNDQVRQTFDQPTVVATPGTDAAVVAQLRADLESGALQSAGAGIHTNTSA